MRKIISKIAGLMLGLSLAAGVGVTVSGVNSKIETKAESGTWTASSQGFSDQQQLGGNTYSFTDSNISVSFSEASGNGHKYYNNGTAVRSYGGNSFTVSCSAGNLTSITLSNNQSKEVDADVGTYSANSWTGNSSSVTFTVQSGSGNFRTSTITAVYTTGGGGETDPVLQSIAVSGEKTEYNVGDEFVKPTVTATYDKGDPQDVTSSASCTGYNMGVAGEYTVTVSYGGKTTTYDITVTDPSAGDELYSATFTELSTFSYEQNKEFTLNGKDWVASVAQLNGGVFYLGCNSTHAAKGILNDNSSFSDVVIALSAVDSPYASSVSTAHAYAMRFANAYDNVGSVEFFWAGGNNAFQVYLFGDQGSGLEMLASTNYSTSGSAVSGSVKWTASGYGESFSEFVIVARPGATGSTAVSKTLRAATFKIYEGEEEQIDPTKKDIVIKQGGVAADGIELVYSSSSYAFKAFEESTELSDITWSVSDQTVATISAAGALSCVKPGSVVVYAEKEGYNKASASITITKGSVSTVVVSGSMTKTDYYVGDEWSNAGLTVTANYSSGLNEDVTSSAAWSYNPVSPALNVESVVVTATFGGKSGSSSAQSVSVTRANPIQALYSKAKGASTGEFYGYYVGFATGSGPIVMDGAYGIMLYNSSQDVSSWTEGETILHISSGTIDIYNGLYEVKSYTVETVSSADVAKPIVHTTTGSESATDANRLTNATGVVAAAPTKGSFTGNPAASDIQFTFTVGSNTFTVYYKKAAQTSEVMAALADSLENHTEITLNGFTSWYNNFQLTMIGLVEAVESYTAEDFAQDLLDQTDAVCAGYKDGDNNHDALEEIWSDLASKDKYPSLPTEQKNILADADRDESGSVVEQAMARYDYLTGKYNLSNFINGRTPMVVAGARFVQTSANTNSSTIIIVVVALTSITSIGVLLVIKRKRSLVK